MADLPDRTKPSARAPYAAPNPTQLPIRPAAAAEPAPDDGEPDVVSISDLIVRYGYYSLKWEENRSALVERGVDEAKLRFELGAAVHGCTGGEVTMEMVEERINRWGPDIVRRSMKTDGGGDGEDVADGGGVEEDVAMDDSADGTPCGSPSDDDATPYWARPSRDFGSPLENNGDIKSKLTDTTNDSNDHNSIASQLAVRATRYAELSSKRKRSTEHTLEHFPNHGPVISTTNPRFLPGIEIPNPFFEPMPRPEVWHRHMPRSGVFALGDTPYSARAMSDQIDADLARGPGRRLGGGGDQEMRVETRPLKPTMWELPSVSHAEVLAVGRPKEAGDESDGEDDPAVPKKRKVVQSKL